MESNVSDENDTRNKKNSKCDEGGLSNVKQEEVTINIDEHNEREVQKQNKIQEEAVDRNQLTVKTISDGKIATDSRISGESKRNLKVLGNAMDTSISEEIINVLHVQPVKEVGHMVKSTSPDDQTNVDVNTKDVVHKSDNISGNKVSVQNDSMESEIYLSFPQSQDTPLITTKFNASREKDDKENSESIMTFPNENTIKTHVTPGNFENSELKGQKFVSHNQNTYEMENDIYSSLSFLQLEIGKPERFKLLGETDEIREKISTMKISNKNNEVNDSTQLNDFTEALNYKENTNYFIWLTETERKAATMKVSNKDRDVKEKNDNINNKNHSYHLESDRSMQDNKKMSNNIMSNEIQNNRLKMELRSPKDLENQNSQLQSEQCKINENVNIKDQSQAPAFDFNSQLLPPSDVSTKSPKKPKPLPRKIHNVTSPIKLSNFNSDTLVGESEMLPENQNKNPVPVPKKRKITAEKLQNQNKIQEPASKPKHGSYDKNIKSTFFDIVVKDRDNAKDTRQSRYSLGNVYKCDTRSISDLHKTEDTSDNNPAFSTLRTCESLNDLTFDNKIKRHLQSSPPSSLTGINKSSKEKEKKFPAANFIIKKLKKHFRISVKAKSPKPSSKFYV